MDIFETGPFMILLGAFTIYVGIFILVNNWIRRLKGQEYDSFGWLLLSAAQVAYGATLFIQGIVTLVKDTFA